MKAMGFRKRMGMLLIVTAMLLTVTISARRVGIETLDFAFQMSSSPLGIAESFSLALGKKLCSFQIIMQWHFLCFYYIIMHVVRLTL